MAENRNKEFWNKRDEEAIQKQRGAAQQIARDIKEGSDLSGFARKWAASILQGMSESEPRRGRGRPRKVPLFAPGERKALLEEAASALLAGRPPANPELAAETLLDWSRGLQAPKKPANRSTEHPYAEMAIMVAVKCAFGMKKTHAYAEVAELYGVDPRRVDDAVKRGSQSQQEAEQWLAGASLNMPKK